MSLGLLLYIVIGWSALCARPADAAWSREVRPLIASGRSDRRAMAPAIGVHGAYDYQADAPGVGLHSLLPIGGLRVFSPAVELFLGDSLYWQANADMMVRRPLLWRGVGLTVADGARFGKQGIQVGYNLFLRLQQTGVRRPERLLRWFVEARWTYVDNSHHFRPAAGLSVVLFE